MPSEPSRHPLSMFLRRPFWTGPAPWILLLFLASNLLIAQWKGSLEEFRRQNFLLGTRGTLRAQSAPPGTVRFDWSAGERLGEFWPYIPDAATHRLVILSGMSQMYAINEEQPGDLTIAEALDDAMAPKGVRVFGLAAPNLSNEEALFLLLSLLSDPKTRPDVFIYGVCFDKFRNLDLRPAYQEFLRKHPAAWKLEEDSARTLAAVYPLAADKILRSLGDIREAEKARADDALEARVRGLAEEVLPVAAARKDLNASVQMQMFLFRNWLLGIKPTSKRPVIQGRHELNRQFLQMMIDIAARHGVRTICYVIPLNPLAENPYIPEQYASFKEWLERICSEKGVPFANLENVVPSDEWGIFMGGPDFKHFKEAAHRRTAQAIVERFGTILDAESSREGRR